MNWLNWIIPISSGFQFQFNSNSKSFNSIPIQFMLNWIELIINSNSIHELIRALAGAAVAALLWHDIELLCVSMALLRMMVWRWLPHMGCWCGGGCANMACYWVIMCWYGPIWDAGVTVAALYGMLVWLPHMGCWCGEPGTQKVKKWFASVIDVITMKFIHFKHEIYLYHYF